jgi:hypothetical protein
MPQKHDKPDDPVYSGGEDESGASREPNAKKPQQPKNYPVDESDAGPATAPDDTGEGA